MARCLHATRCSGSSWAVEKTEGREARKRCPMFHLATSDLLYFLNTYGYWAVLLFIAIERTGIPFPGETMLLVAAIYAGTTHRLAIPLVIVAAAIGAILGDNLGFWAGRQGALRRLPAYARYCV